MPKQKQLLYIIRYLFQRFPELKAGSMYAYLIS